MTLLQNQQITFLVFLIYRWESPSEVYTSRCWEMLWFLEHWS